MNNWRTVSLYMTEDEAWNELADLEMLGIHYNLEEKMIENPYPEDFHVVSPWMTILDADLLRHDCEDAFGSGWRVEKREEREEKMSKCVICENCGGLKHIEAEPCDYDSTSGSSWSGFCICPNEEIEEEKGYVKFLHGVPYLDTRLVLETVKEMIEEYTDYARQEIRFCPYCGAALGMRE